MRETPAKCGRVGRVMTTVDEITSLAEDLIKVMSNSDEEKQGLMRTKFMLEKWSSLLVDVREKNIQEKVKELKVQWKEEQKILAKEQKSSEKDLEKIQSEIENMKSACTKTDQMSAKLSEEYKELKSQQQQILLSQEQLKSGSDELKKKYKPMLDLHMHVSNTRFQSDGVINSDNDIRGYVVNKSNVQPFHLNKEENSDFYISNHLWSLMEADW